MLQCEIPLKKWSNTKLFDVAPFIEWLQVLTDQPHDKKIQQTNVTNKCNKQMQQTNVTNKQMQQINNQATNQCFGWSVLGSIVVLIFHPCLTLICVFNRNCGCWRTSPRWKRLCPDCSQTQSSGWRRLGRWTPAPPHINPGVDIYPSPHCHLFLVLLIVFSPSLYRRRFLGRSWRCLRS